MTIIHDPHNPQPEMPSTPEKRPVEFPDKPHVPGPEIENPRGKHAPRIEEQPEAPKQKPEIHVPGPNLPTPENPEGYDSPI